MQITYIPNKTLINLIFIGLLNTYLVAQYYYIYIFNRNHRRLRCKIPLIM